MKLVSTVAVLALCVAAVSASQVSANCAADCERFGAMMLEISQHSFPGDHDQAKHADQELCSRLPSHSFQQACHHAVHSYGLKQLANLMQSSPGALCDNLQCGGMSLLQMEVQPHSGPGDEESWPELALANEDPEIAAEQNEAMLQAEAAYDYGEDLLPPDASYPEPENHDEFINGAPGPAAAPAPDASAARAAYQAALATQAELQARTPRQTAKVMPYYETKHDHTYRGVKGKANPCTGGACKATPKIKAPYPGDKTKTPDLDSSVPRPGVDDAQPQPGPGLSPITAMQADASLWDKTPRQTAKEQPFSLGPKHDHPKRGVEAHPEPCAGGPTSGSCAHTPKPEQPYPGGKSESRKKELKQEQTTLKKPTDEQPQPGPALHPGDALLQDTSPQSDLRKYEAADKAAIEQMMGHPERAHDASLDAANAGDDSDENDDDTVAPAADGNTLVEGSASIKELHQKARAKGHPDSFLDEAEQLPPKGSHVQADPYHRKGAHAASTIAHAAQRDPSDPEALTAIEKLDKLTVSQKA